MTITRSGQVNLAGITNPGILVVEQLPQSQLIGVPTNVMGYVGVASWGPVGAVQVFASLDQGVLKYGAPIARKYDFMTHAMVGFQEGATLYCKGVRVSDGTDTAASFLVTGNGTFTGKYTGIKGNGIKIGVQGTQAANCLAVVVGMPGQVPERFDNIPASTAAIFWNAVAAAINGGTQQRAPSNFVIFSVLSAPASLPTVGATYQLSGGTDGDTGVTSSTMVGTDVRPRTGMYALRGSGCDAFGLIDVTDSTTWAVQLSFGIGEGMIPVTSTVSGDTIANAVATRLSAGIDDPNIWILEGDWPTIQDTVNGVQRLVTPQAQALGLLGNLSPEQSPINKQLYSVIGTQTSIQGILTDDADESVAQLGGIDLIGRSSALGVSYFSFLTGRNASSNTQANGIEYTRMTNFLARSANGLASAKIVGLLQSQRADDPTRAKASAIFQSFSSLLVDTASGSNGYGMIEGALVQCDQYNNLPETIIRYYMFLYWAVRYLSVVRYFIVKLAGGNNVDISVSETPPQGSNASLIGF